MHLQKKRKSTLYVFGKHFEVSGNKNILGIIPE